MFSDVVHKILAIFKMFSFFTARSGYLAVPVAMGAGLAFQLNRTPPPPRVVVVGGGIMGAATGKLHFSLSFQGLVVAPRFIICLYGWYAVYAGVCATDMYYIHITFIVQPTVCLNGEKRSAPLL